MKKRLMNDDDVIIDFNNPKHLRIVCTTLLLTIGFLIIFIIFSNSLPSDICGSLKERMQTDQMLWEQQCEPSFEIIKVDDNNISLKNCSKQVCPVNMSERIISTTCEPKEVCDFE